MQYHRSYRSSRDTRLLAICALIISASIIGLLHVGDIDQWERAHGYPFGRMCDLNHSCPVR